MEADSGHGRAGTCTTEDDWPRTRAGKLVLVVVGAAVAWAVTAAAYIGVMRLGVWVWPW